MICGTDDASGSLFTYVDLEARIPARDPLRKIRQVVSDALVNRPARHHPVAERGRNEHYLIACEIELGRQKPVDPEHQAKRHPKGHAPSARSPKLSLHHQKIHEGSGLPDRDRRVRERGKPAQARGQIPAERRSKALGPALALQASPEAPKDEPRCNTKKNLPSKDPHHGRKREESRFIGRQNQELSGVLQRVCCISAAPWASGVEEKLWRVV